MSTDSATPKQPPSMRSWLDWLASLPPAERESVVAELTAPERMALAEALHDWKSFAREKQLPPPGDWFIWVVQAGRGFGKTRTGAEYVRMRIDSGDWRVVNIAGPTSGDIMDYMILGTPAAPGLMGVWPDHQRPRLNESKQRLTCHNGAVIRYRSAEEAERFRGPQADGGWCDEIDSWRPKRMTPKDAWALFELGIRLGPDPRIVATSTPKPSRIIASLAARKDVVITRGSTYENRANLAPQFFDSIVSLHAGTRMGRQEIEGELLDAEEDAGAYYLRLMAQAARDGRIGKVPYCPDLPVTTAWDLGVSDSTSIWFIQRAGLEHRAIDYYEASGEGLAHYAKVLQDKGYIYDEHIAPFDIKVRELGTGRSRLEVAQGLGIRFRIAPGPTQVTVADGIEAVRNVIPLFWYDEEKCARGIEALRSYTKEWDDELQNWSDRPLHDWSSHGADAMRAYAVARNERRRAAVRSAERNLRWVV